MFVGHAGRTARRTVPVFANCAQAVPHPTRIPKLVRRTVIWLILELRGSPSHSRKSPLGSRLPNPHLPELATPRMALPAGPTRRLCRRAWLHCTCRVVCGACSRSRNLPHTGRQTLATSHLRISEIASPIDSLPIVPPLGVRQKQPWQQVQKPPSQNLGTDTITDGLGLNTSTKSTWSKQM